MSITDDDTTRAQIAMETAEVQESAPEIQFTPNQNIPPNYNPYRVCKTLEVTTPQMSALASPEQRNRLQAVIMKGKQFPQGSTLNVEFIGGSSQQHQIVRSAVDRELVPHINLQFNWGTSNGDIRISFNPSDGAWSYIGTDVYTIPAGLPTMNLGWLVASMLLVNYKMLLIISRWCILRGRNASLFG